MSRLAQMKGDLKLAVSQHSNIQKMIKDYRKKIADLNRDKNSSEATLEKYRVLLEGLVHENNHFVQKRAMWTIVIESQELLIDQVQAAIVDLTDRIQVSIVTVRELTSDNLNLKVNYKPLKKEYDAITFDIAVVSKRNAELDAQLATFSVEFQALRAEFNTL